MVDVVDVVGVTGEPGQPPASAGWTPWSAGMAATVGPGLVQPDHRRPGQSRRHPAGPAPRPRLWGAMASTDGAAHGQLDRCRPAPHPDGDPAHRGALGRPEGAAPQDLAASSRPTVGGRQDHRAGPDGPVRRQLHHQLAARGGGHRWSRAAGPRPAGLGGRTHRCRRGSRCVTSGAAGTSRGAGRGVGREYRLGTHGTGRDTTGTTGAVVDGVQLADRALSGRGTGRVGPYGDPRGADPGEEQGVRRLDDDRRGLPSWARPRGPARPRPVREDGRRRRTGSAVEPAPARLTPVRMPAPATSSADPATPAATRPFGRDRPAERSTKAVGSGSASTEAARSARWWRRRSSNASVMARWSFSGR